MIELLGDRNCRKSKRDPQERIVLRPPRVAGASQKHRRPCSALRGGEEGSSRSFQFSRKRGRESAALFVACHKKERKREERRWRKGVSLFGALVEVSTRMERQHGREKFSSTTLEEKFRPYVGKGGKKGITLHRPVTIRRVLRKKGPSATTVGGGQKQRKVVPFSSLEDGKSRLPARKAGEMCSLSMGKKRGHCMPRGGERIRC